MPDQDAPGADEELDSEKTAEHPPPNVGEDSGAVDEDDESSGDE